MSFDFALMFDGVISEFAGSGGDTVFQDSSGMSVGHSSANLGGGNDYYHTDGRLAGFSRVDGMGGETYYDGQGHQLGHATQNPMGGGGSSGSIWNAGGTVSRESGRR